MKGLSPLVATVLLIAFTVAVAGVVSVWLTGFTKRTTITVSEEADKQIFCSYGAVSLGSVKFCSGYLSGRIDNTGSVDLGNVSIKVVYSGSTTNFPLCLSGNSVVNCTAANLTMSPRQLFNFNFSTSSGFQVVRATSNCTSVFDDVSSGGVSTSC